MLKLLIVDDEKIIRDGMKNAIDWESYNIEVCGVKKNGREALEFCMTEMPDIIITDIKMAQMSGLEFIEKLGEQRKKAKIIILSGFNDFEYSKRALRNSVFEYLLKPIKPKDIVETMIRARDAILAEREEADTKAGYMKWMEKNEAIIRSHYFGGIVCGEHYPNEDQAELLRLLKLDSDTQKFVALALSSNGVSGMSYYMLFSEFEKDGDCFVFSAPDGRYGAMCRVRNDAESAAVAFCKRAEKVSSSISVGVSDVFCGIEGLRNGFEEATLALGHMDITGGNQIIYYSRTDNRVKILEKNEEKLNVDIVDAIDRLDKSAVSELIKKFSMDNPDMSVERFARDMSKAVLSVCGYIIKIEEKPDRIIGDWRVLSDRISSFTETDVISEFCIYIFSGVIDKIIDAKSLNSSPIVDKIVEYLDSNFDKSFSLDVIAQNVYLSPNYVSTLFRRETGKRLSDYVVEVRIEKAKEFLKDPELRAYEIAEKVGYSDSRYFGNLFKKHTGVSLTEYRKIYYGRGAADESAEMDG